MTRCFQPHLFLCQHDNFQMIKPLSLSLQSSAVEQILDILTNILSWEIAEVVSPYLPRGLWSHIVIRVFLLLRTVCPQHPPYPVLPSCLLSRAFPYLQPGDVGGRRSAPAVCQSLTSADPTWLNIGWWNLVGRCTVQKSRPSSNLGVPRPQNLAFCWVIMRK